MCCRMWSSRQRGGMEEELPSLAAAGPTGAWISVLTLSISCRAICKPVLARANTCSTESPIGPGDGLLGMGYPGIVGNCRGSIDWGGATGIVIFVLFHVTVTRSPLGPTVSVRMTRVEFGGRLAPPPIPGVGPASCGAGVPPLDCGCCGGVFGARFCARACARC